MAGDPKTPEEYLLTYHEKLLVERKEATESINTYLLLSYALIGVAVLLKEGLVSEFSQSGLKFKIDNPVLLDYLVVVVLLVYVLLDFHLSRLARIFREIRNNSSSLKSANVQSRPIDITDMRLFVSGASGLIFAIGRSATKVVLEGLLAIAQFDWLRHVIAQQQNVTLTSLVRAFGAFFPWFFSTFWISLTLLNRLILGCVLMLIPLFAIEFYILTPHYHEAWLNTHRKAIFLRLYDVGVNLGATRSILFVAGVILILTTLYSSLLLFISYAKDLFEQFVKDLGVSAEQLRASLGPLARELGNPGAQQNPGDDEFQAGLRRLHEKIRHW
jgi:hypothetical protein